MIYIIRHGRTEKNRANVLQGRSDLPLNAEGVLQAERAAERLRHIRFSHVFSSPLRRAVQTARLVAPGREITVDERLIEMDYGPYEGVSFAELPPEIVSFFGDFAHISAPEGMESLASVVARAGEFIEDIRGLDGDILVSTHAVAMKGILEYLTPLSGGSYWSRYIGNCAVYAAEHENGVIGIPREL